MPKVSFTFVSNTSSLNSFLRGTKVSASPPTGTKILEFSSSMIFLTAFAIVDDIGALKVINNEKTI